MTTDIEHGEPIGVGDPTAPSSAVKVEEGFDDIPMEDCLRLLREGAVGLLALSGGKAPDLRPVNFALYRRQIVMRTGHGRIFEGARAEEPAAFVISESDRLEHTGWSVVVTGRLSICDPTDAAIRTRVRPWARADKGEWVVLSIDQVTGRRISSFAGGAGDGGAG
ncbi:MAG TPA: pyridoxamine 5'-phosphate oxidase family protein [Deltaproteobacteria bacterium]|nr:pyridoxamine 5'-phosphate oxidase family protein [Deltaproteobacteria bacterium]